MAVHEDKHLAFELQGKLWEVESHPRPPLSCKVTGELNENKEAGSPFYLSEGWHLEQLSATSSHFLTVNWGIWLGSKSEGHSTVSSAPPPNITLWAMGET